MLKADLISHINRYHLSGLVESVVWSVTDGVVNCKFVSMANSIAGNIIFPFIEISSETEEIGVYNTSSLIKFLSIMQDEIEVSLEKEHSIWMKMGVTDGVYEGSYSLADTRNSADVPDVEEPTVYEVSFIIDKEFKDQYLKAYKALGGINRFTIQAGKKIKVTLGNKESYATKISFEKTSDDFLPLKPLAFSGEAMAEILKNNPDLNESSLEVCQDGLMKITIYGGTDKVTYYLIELEEV